MLGHITTNCLLPLTCEYLNTSKDDADEAHRMEQKQSENIEGGRHGRKQKAEQGCDANF